MSKTDALFKPESVCRGLTATHVTMINGDEPGDGGINVIDGDEVKDFAAV